MGDNYRGLIEKFGHDSPEIARYITTRLQSEYRPVFENDTYTIFARR